MSKTSCRGIIIKDNAILLVKRVLYKKIFYVLPGGTVEEGETFEETLTREVKEETNCTVEIVEFLFQLNSKAAQRISRIYLCNYIEGTPELRKDSVEYDRQSKKNKYIPTWYPLMQIFKINILPKEVKDYLLQNYILKV
ncbi:NUDIX domain-containing protein [bacterium]|nr:MAG: NUDIX domain-containing protein [bacterium]